MPRTRKGMKASEIKVQDQLFRMIETLRKAWVRTEKKERGEVFDNVLLIENFKDSSEQAARVLSEVSGLSFKKSIGLVASLKTMKAPIPFPNWNHEMKNELDEEFDTQIYSS